MSRPSGWRLLAVPSVERFLKFRSPPFSDPALSAAQPSHVRSVRPVPEVNKPHEVNTKLYLLLTVC